jgi:thiol-disulfide isomerase/thioredoxin
MQRRRLLAAGAAACTLPVHWTVRAEPGFDVQPWPNNKAAPAQLGIDAAGRSWNLADLRGRALLINFWASWCEPCREEMPSLQRLATSRAADLQVLTVNFKDPLASAQRFISQSGLQLPVLRDEEGALARQWGVRVFPSTALVDADGVVQSTVRGAIDWTGPVAQRLLQPLRKRGPASVAQGLAP